MRAVGRDVSATDAYAVGGLNFLRDAPLAADVAALVTNPPFNQLTKFIVRALQHLDNDVVQDAILLLRAGPSNRVGARALAGSHFNVLSGHGGSGFPPPGRAGPPFGRTRSVAMMVRRKPFG
jgi:hypothetical protein